LATVDVRIGLVDHDDVDIDIRTEHALPGAVAREPVDRCQRIRRDQRAPPADNVPVIVIVRRLDQNQLETPHADNARRINRISMWAIREKEISCTEILLSEDAVESQVFTRDEAVVARHSGLAATSHRYSDIGGLTVISSDHRQRDQRGTARSAFRLKY